MALLCALPHNNAHELWFDHKSMLSLPPSDKSGSSFCRKNRAKFIGSGLRKQFPVRVPSNLASLATCFLCGYKYRAVSPPRPKAKYILLFLVAEYLCVRSE